MAAIFHTFLNGFFRMKVYEFLFKFHRSLSLGNQLRLIDHWLLTTVWSRPGDKPLSEPMMVRLALIQWRLTHWGRVTHECVCKLSIIVSDNGLSPDRHQALIWTNVAILSIRHLETYFDEILFKIQKFLLKNYLEKAAIKKGKIL